jgi:hypothetical protein
MPKLRAALALVLVALWAGMGSHCLLESITGFSVLQCQEIHSTSSAPSSHCESDGCQTIENGHYFSTVNNLTPILPEIALPVETFAPSESTPPDEVSRLLRTGVAPDLLPTWQFSQRMALAPRAPSPVS